MENPQDSLKVKFRIKEDPAGLANNLSSNAKEDDLTKRLPVLVETFHQNMIQNVKVRVEGFLCCSVLEQQRMRRNFLPFGVTISTSW